jgi:hypothetical protein
MAGFIKYSLACLFITSLTIASTREIKKEFEVRPDQRIEVNGVNGMRLKISSWDKNVIGINLKVDVSCSDDDYEKIYLDEFDVKGNSDGSLYKVDISETKKERGWSSFLGIKFRLFSHFSKDIFGEIFFPKNIDLAGVFNYGELVVEQLNGNIVLEGRGMNCTIHNSPRIKKILNDYGNLTLLNCGGGTEVYSRSCRIDVKDYSGSLLINSDYSTISLYRISSDIKIESRSGNIDIANAGGNILIKSDYTDISAISTKGVIQIENQSGTINLNGGKGFEINAQYANGTVENISSKSKFNSFVKSRSGRWKFSNITGNIEIDDSYSEFRFESITGDLKVTTRSCSISGDNINGDINLSTNFVPIHLQNVTAKEVKISAKSDPVEISFINSPQHVSIENDYGDINLFFPYSYSGKAVIKSRYGKIDSDFDATFIKSDDSENIPSDRQIFVETRSGNIKLKKK